MATQPNVTPAPEGENLSDRGNAALGAGDTAFGKNTSKGRSQRQPPRGSRGWRTVIYQRNKDEPSVVMKRGPERLDRDRAIGMKIIRAELPFREIVDRAVLSLKDAGGPSFLIE